MSKDFIWMGRVSNAAVTQLFKYPESSIRKIDVSIPSPTMCCSDLEDIETLIAPGMLIGV